MAGSAGPGQLKLLVTVTFNVNQLRSHLLPIVALPEVREIVLVTDASPSPIPKVRVVVPPRLLVRIATRAGAKLLVTLWLALRERPDWVIGFNFVPHGFTAIVASRLVGARSLYEMIGGTREWAEGGWQSDNNILGRLPRPLPRLERAIVGLIRRSTAVGVMGERGRVELVERGVDPARVVVIPPAVETVRFQPEPSGVRRYDIVTACMLLENKRVGDLIQSAARLRARRPGLRVAIAGEGPLEESLRRLATDLGLAENVEFLGFRVDIDRIYADSRVFTLPSAYEGLSIAMLEAMASGLPVVVTDVGEHASFVRNGVNGVLVPPGDVDALTNELEDLLDDEARRAALGHEAAADAAARVSVEAVTQVYRRVLSEDGGGADQVSSTTVRPVTENE